MKTKMLLFSIMMFFSFFSSAMPIIENGKSSWSIYVPKNSIAADKTAAKELQSFLLKASGVKLEITNDAKGTNQILIGTSEAAEKLFPALKTIKWKSDEIMIVPAGNNLILTGDSPRGTLYAVYECIVHDGICPLCELSAATIETVGIAEHADECLL